MIFDFEERLGEVQRKIHEYEEYLVTAPAGRIGIVRIRNCDRFYISTGSVKTGDYKREYISNENKELIKAMVYKLYAEAKLEDLKAEEKAICLYLSNMVKTNHCEKLLGSSKVFSEILGLVLSAKKRKFREWETTAYSSSAAYPEERVIPTEKGVFVRSKSESFYVEALDEMGVAFRYEQDVNLNGRTYNADIVAKSEDGNEIIIEHLGMLDDESYRAHNAEKIKQYILAGYVPGVNLILVGETKRHPLSLVFVRKLLSLYFK